MQRYIDDVPEVRPCITVGTHFFRVNNPDKKLTQAILSFNKNYNHIGPSAKKGPGGRIMYEVKNRFYSYIPVKEEYRYHIEQLDIFLELLENNGITPADVDLVEKFYKEAPKIEIKPREGFELRDYQKEIKSFILNKEVSQSRSRLASLPTGTGKTVIALNTITDLHCRIALTIPASYADKWKSDVLEQLDIEESDIYMVNSRTKLVKALSLAKDDAFYKVYIFNQETLASFYKEYESSWFSEFDEHYGSNPEDIFEKLGVGVTIIDEAHEAINMVFKLFTYMNVPLNIGLSGTFRTRDTFLLKIQKLIYPSEIRKNTVQMSKYIDFQATSYTFANIQRAKIRQTYNGAMYSQGAFEESIFKNKNKDILKNFLEMIDSYFVEDYLERKKDGEKCAIYASRIEMCEIIVAYLKHKHPGLDIRKYTGGDPYENAIEADIRVTTRGSCGTAIDIKRLISLITVDNVDSDVGNLQLLGRLRENKVSDTIPRFRQLYCANVPKHTAYQRNRHMIFSDRVATINYSRYPKPLDVGDNETLSDYR